MKTSMSAPPTTVGTLALIAALATSVPAIAQEGDGDGLDLRRVMLSTGGVGYFEYEATVSGDTDLTLDIRLDQVDDVLKSIVVFDDEGGIGQISLPGQTPLEEVFRDLPFGPEDLETPVGLLTALRGVEVRAEGPRAIEGRVLSVTPEQRIEDGATETVHRVTLMTDEGLAQLILEETDRLTFLDSEVRDQVAEALTAVSGNSAEDQRTLTIDLDGEGERTVRVAYLVEIPLWKTAYRLTFNEAGEGVASLQGWAVIENFSGEDWDGVDLTVASGNPVTFRQALYDAYYVDRPEIPVEVLGRILPPVDEGGVAMPPMQAAEMEADDGMAVAGLAAPSSRIADQAPMPEPAPAPGGQADLLAAESTEATTQVLFRFPRPVTVESGHSLLLPIVSRDAPVDRPLLYQPSVHARHPMATAELENTSESGLPPGILTIYERDTDSGLVSYLGDARLDTLPVGDSRMVAYALDQSVTVDREQLSEESLVRVSIVDGVLRRRILGQQTTVYTIEGAANRDNQVILEHPRPGGEFEAVEGTDGAEMTAGALRIPVDVPAGETVEHRVTFERTVLDTIDISGLRRDRVMLFASSSQLPEDVRAALNDVAERMAGVEALDRAVQQTEADIQAIINDQGRIRSNLQSLPTDSDLYQRYLADLVEQEDRLEALRAELEDRRSAAQAAREALREHIAMLSVG